MWIYLGDETLRDIARELVGKVKASATIDWTIKEGVRAAMGATVKRLLRKYGYPPDKQEEATKLVLEQAEVLCGTLPPGYECIQAHSRKPLSRR